MTIRVAALMIALAVTGFALLPAKAAFLVAGAGAVVGGILLLPSQPKGGGALLVVGSALVVLGIVTFIREHLATAREAEETADAIRRKMGGRRS